MRNNKLNYVIVGSFVLAMIFGLIFSIAMLTGRTGATDKYFAVYRNVTGVKFGTQVLYEGFPIGQVEEVTPVAEGSKMSFRVDFTVVEGWRIPEDSVAKIAALIRGHFLAGGQQCQFNLVDREMLLEAKRNPEQYGDLMVRVAGYSAPFTSLWEDLQDEIIARTGHAVA